MKNVCFAILILLMFFSCQRKEENFFRGELKKIVYEDAYEIQGSQIYIDSIGNISLCKIGSHLLLTKYDLPYFVQLYDVDSLQSSKMFFAKGKGPEDFLSFSITKSDHQSMYIRDFQNKEVRKINLQSLFENKRINIENTFNYKKIVEPFNSFHINDTSLLVKAYDSNRQNFYYTKYNPSTHQLTTDCIWMYNYPVTYQLRNKISTLADVMKPDGTKVASLTGLLDQIDIINLNNPKKNISVTTSNEVLTYDYLQQTPQNQLHDVYCFIPFCTDEMIFAIYYNKNATTNKHEIHVIDWDGNPKFKLITDRSLNAIFLDDAEGCLYALENHTEMVFVYNIKDILAKY